MTYQPLPPRRLVGWSGGGPLGGLYRRARTRAYLRATDQWLRTMPRPPHAPALTPGQDQYESFMGSARRRAARWWPR